MRGFGFGGILGVAGLECRGFRVQVLRGCKELSFQALGCMVFSE